MRNNRSKIIYICLGIIIFFIAVFFLMHWFIMFFDEQLLKVPIFQKIGIKQYIKLINIPFYIFLIYIYIKILIFSGKKYQSHFKNRNLNKHGGREWETLNNMDKTYNKVSQSGFYNGKGGAVIGWDLKKSMLYLDDGAVNNLIIGITRSGKGIGFVEPTLDAYSRAEKMSNRASLIITDPKGELCEKMSYSLTERGYNIKIINILDPDLSSSYNPLSLILDYWKNGTSKGKDKAETLMTTLADMIYISEGGDKFWSDLAANLFKAVGLLLLEEYSQSTISEEEITLMNIYNIVNDYGQVDEQTKTSPLSEYLETMKGTKAYNAYATIKLSGEKTLTSIYTTMLNGLSKFTSESIAKMMSQTNFSLEEIGFGEKPTALFLVKPDFDSTFDIIPSLFISQLYYVLSEKATIHKSKRCTREVVFMLDEFGNMPKIKDIDSILTVCLGRGIRFNLIVQDYSQLKIKYEKEYGTIKSNCANHIYIMSNSIETQEEVSKMAGTYTQKEETISGQFLDEKNISKSWVERPLITPVGLSQLLPGESIVIRPMTRETKDHQDLISNPIGNLGENRLKRSFDYLNYPKDVLISNLFNELKSLKITHTFYNLEEHRVNLNIPTSNDTNNDKKIEILKAILKNQLLEDKEIESIEKVIKKFSLESFEEIKEYLIKKYSKNGIEKYFKNKENIEENNEREY